MGRELSHKDLSGVALASQVDLLGIDLIGDVNQQNIEELVVDVIRLEDNLDFEGVVGWDSSLFRNKDEGYLFTIVLNTADQALKVKIDWEG